MSNILEAYGSEYSFSIVPADTSITTVGLTRLNIDNETKLQLSGLVQQIPNAVTSVNMQLLYTVSFPKGMPHTLTKLKRGGEITAITDPETGRFIGQASLKKATTQALTLSVFTGLSIATGQYFLTEIHNDLSVIRQGIDQILAFLHGEKQSELLAEINFARYVYQNYSSIMFHNEQRIATITSLQSSRKIALSGIEFYINDLNSVLTPRISKTNPFENVAEGVFRDKKCIDLSVQLYALSGILEALVSMNTDSNYLENVKSSIAHYIEKCDKRVLAAYNVLLGKMPQGLKTNAAGKPLLSTINNTIDELEEVKVAEKNQQYSAVLESVSSPAKYVIDAEGNTFIDKAS